MVPRVNGDEKQDSCSGPDFSPFLRLFNRQTKDGHSSLISDHGPRIKRGASPCAEVACLVLEVKGPSSHLHTELGGGALLLPFTPNSCPAQGPCSGYSLPGTLLPGIHRLTPFLQSHVSQLSLQVPVTLFLPYFTASINTWHYLYIHLFIYFLSLPLQCKPQGRSFVAVTTHLWYQNSAWHIIVAQ